MILLPDQRRAALEELTDWRYSLRAFHAAFEAPTPADAITLLARISAIGADHAQRICVDWRNRHVFVRLRDTALEGVDDTDLRLATEISVARLGLASPRPELCREIEIAIDTDDPRRLAATWAAALGYEIDDEGDLYDRFRRGPALWFQETRTPATSAFHIDVTVADDVGDTVLAEVVEAGGERIDDRFRPAFTVVADPDGNRLCICTQLGRD